MEIKIFGPGCTRCNETEQLVKDVLAAKGVAAFVTKVSDLKEMMAAGIMSTPAVAIDGIVKSTGKIPSKEEVAAWIDGGSTPSSARKTAGAAATADIPTLARKRGAPMPKDQKKPIPKQ